MNVKFTVPGDPRGKERPRVPRQGKAYTPQKTKNYEESVRWCYRSVAHGYMFPDNAMLDVKILAYYPIPKSVSKKKRNLMLKHIIRPTVKPDYDNIGKIVCDALNKIAFRDDSSVVDGLVRKFYSENPRVVVSITEIEIPEET